MNDADEPRFGEMIAALAANWNTEITSARILLLWMAMRDAMTMAQFEKAATRALKECEFFPSAAELIRFSKSTVRVSGGRIEVWLGVGNGWGIWGGSLGALPGLTQPEREDLARQLSEQRRSLTVRS